MKKHTIKELEEMTGENIEEVMIDYIESCKRTAHYDFWDNIKYFMNENNLKDSEYERIEELFMTLWVK